MFARFVRNLLRRWPIRGRDQALFAEALSQALSAGIEISAAVAVAANANPSFRFKQALGEMASHCRAGYSIEASLKKTGAIVADALLSALRIGEYHGCLARNLSVFAHRTIPRVEEQLARAVGRPPEATRFAAALADLLTDRRLTTDLIQDAAALAAEKHSTFRRIIKRVVVDIKNGEPFAQAIQGHVNGFDSLFCELVAATSRRQELRAVLMLLGKTSVGVHSDLRK